MFSSDLLSIGAVLLGSSALSALITGLFARRKTSAEAEARLSEQVLNWANSLRDEIVKLKEEIHLLRGENHKLTVEVNELRLLINKDQ